MGSLPHVPQPKNKQKMGNIYEKMTYVHITFLVPTIVWTLEQG